MSIAEITTLVQTLGLPITLTIVFVYFFLTKLTTKLDEITKGLEKISRNVGKDLLTIENTVMIFKLMLAEHIQLKLEYAREILIENDIFNRRKQIESLLKNEYVRITTEEANKLSRFNTPAGDLGVLLLNNVDFNKFLNDIYNVFFQEYQLKDKNDKAQSLLVIDRKIKDMKSVMDGYVNELIRLIEHKIRTQNI